MQVCHSKKSLTCQKTVLTLLENVIRKKCNAVSRSMVADNAAVQIYRVDSSILAQRGHIIVAAAYSLVWSFKGYGIL